MKLRRLSTREARFETKLAALTRYEAAQNAAVERTVRTIVRAVRRRGDAALLAYARRLDRVRAGSVAKLEVGRTALARALRTAPAREIAAPTQTSVRRVIRGCLV